MTSANHPGQPMLTDNENALKLPADIYLLHNREIVNRIDDTVLIPYKDRCLFIRKSRGYVPDPIHVGYGASVLSLGAQRNVTASVSKSKKVYTTQYIGNVGNYDVLEYLEQAIDHMTQLTGTEKGIDCLAIDSHPGYTSRRLVKKHGHIPVIEVQHHFAHAVSLMVDAGMDEEMCTICVDGMGYGDDGQAWGGEVLTHSLTDYKRSAHLEYLPHIGGDQAVLDPRRMVYGIYDELGLEYHNVTPEEEEVFSKLTRKAGRTSSLGRVLDALAFSLGICSERTYDGEPAMSCEIYLEQGLKRRSNRYRFESSTKGGVILTKPLFEQLYRYALTPKGPKRLTGTQ
jgi:hydrogenase maturation protein HypF